MKHRTAVVGFGCAGYHAVKSMREEGYTGEIDVYTDTEWAPANPMLTTYYIYGKLKKEGTLPFGPIRKLAEKYQFSIVTENVEKVLSEEKEVLLADGQKNRYDQILISTGARAFLPPIPGINLDGVFPMRTVADAERLKSVLETRNVRQAIVVGASMVGIKLVELFYSRGIHCTLMDMAPYIFPISAVPEVAAEIESRLREKNVDLIFSKALEKIEADRDGQLRVMFADGESISGDIVLMCIGTRANTQVADEKIEINRGIVIDQKMQTNMPGIYSAGDCCEGNNLQTGQTQIIGIWDNAARQGETAGVNMAGGNRRYHGNMLHNITHFMGMDFIGYGDNRMDGEEFTYEDKEKGQMFVVRVKDGVPVCMNFLDSFGASGVFKSYMIQKLEGKKENLSPVARVRMIRDGVPERLINFLMKVERENE